MKKKLLFAGLIVIVFMSIGYFATNAFTHIAFAADGDLIGSDVACSTNDSWTYCNPVSKTVRSIPGAGKVIVQYVLGLLGIIALFFLIYAGVVYITSAGDEKRVALAKTMITNTVIGLGIALLVYSLLTTLITVLKIK